MKNWALVHNSEDDTEIKIIKDTRENALIKFKNLVREVVNTYTTLGVAVVELEEDGTGSINIDYDITGDGECYTFDVEPNFYDEDEMTFEEFYENWWNEQ